MLYAQPTEESIQATIDVDTWLEQALHTDSDTEKMRLADQSLNVARNMRYDGGVLRASIILAELAARSNNTDQALQYFLEAEAKAKLLKNQTALTRIHIALGDLFCAEKLYPNAARYYTEVIKNEPSNIAICEKLADAYLADLRFDSAEVYYKRLIANYRQTQHYPGMVRIYQKIATVYDQHGNAGKSLYYYLPITTLINDHGSKSEQAMLYNNLGRQYVALRDFKKAVEYFQRAEDRCSYVPCEHPEVMYTNYAVALFNLGDSPQALEYLKKARKLLQEQKDTLALTKLENLAANITLNSNDTYNALKFNETAIELARKVKSKPDLAKAYETAANIHQELYDFEKAIYYYRQYLTLQDSLLLEEQRRREKIEQQRTRLVGQEGQVKYLIASKNLSEAEAEQRKINEDRLKLSNQKLALEKKQAEDQALILLKQRQVDSVAFAEQALKALNLEQQARLEQQRASAEKEALINENLRRQADIDRAQSHADSLASAQQLEVLSHANEVANLELQKKEIFQRYAYWLGALLSLILLLLGVGWLLARRAGRRLRRQNHLIKEQNLEIQEERRKSDTLLLNILPEEIAAELKGRGYASPRKYPSATVVFTDFVNFTSLSSTLTPEELIDELNECFLAFDDICDKHGLEKIKTIGDAYMCAGGIPVPNETHAEDAVRAALEMMQWLNERNSTNKKAVFRDMRIGVHTGAVVAGVIGKNKFAFDIWGDAVNLAARLEENGTPGRVNISKSTAEIIENKFRLEYRGQKEVHNKGLVDMYYVN